MASKDFVVRKGLLVPDGTMDLTNSSTTTGLKITQTGNANAFEVHDQASDTSAFVVKADGKVGFRKNPSSSLTYDVEIGGETLSERFTSSVSGSVGSPAFRFSSDTNNGMYLGGTDILGFSTAGTERMTISAAGVVNIAGSLTVAGSAVGGASAIDGLSDGKSSDNFSYGLGLNALYSITDGQGHQNTAFGLNAGYTITVADNNTLIGARAGNTLDSNDNTVMGYQALRYGTGASNTMIGAYAGEGSSGNSTGAKNTMVGYKSGFAYTTGHSNVSVGYNSNLAQTTGLGITSIGYDSLRTGTAQNYMTAVGHSAGYSHTGTEGVIVGSDAAKNGGASHGSVIIGRQAGYYATGNDNVAIGRTALFSASSSNTGHSNVAIGRNALSALSSGHYNVGIGLYAGDTITTGDNSTLIGYNSGTGLTDGDHNTAIGSYSYWRATDGTYNLVAGYNAGGGLRSGGSNIVLGYNSMAQVNNDGDGNVAIGVHSMNAATGNDVNYNTGVGFSSLQSITEGAKNIAIGWTAGNNITSGDSNVVIGAADVASATGNDQLSISSGDGSPVWITGDSNGNVKLPDGNLDMADNYITTSESNGDVKFKENGTGGFIFYDDDESEYFAIREGGHLQFSLNTAGGSTEQIMQYRDAGGSMRNFMSINSDDLYIHNRAANGRVIIQANTSTAGANDVTAATFEDDKVTFAVQPVLPSSGIKFSDGSQQTVAASGADGNRLPAIKTLLSNADDKLQLSQAGHMGQVAANFNQNKYPIFMPFYSGAGGTFTKASVVINTGVAGAHVGLCFWSEDSNGKPTTKIGSELSFNAESSGTVTLTSQSITLAADTRYWVSWRSHPDSTGNVNFSGYEVAMEPIVMGDQTIPFCNVLFYLTTSAFGSTVSHGSFTSTYRQWWPKMWLEIS